MRSEAWLIEPRDPIVVRDGRSTTELGRVTPFVLPPPNTVAGMVRSSFVARQSHVSPEQAQKLLTIRIARGPFLVQRKPDDRNFVHWVPVPSDVAIGSAAQEQSGENGSGAKRQALLRALVFPLEDGEGVIWPEGTPEGLQLVELASKDGQGHKTVPLAERLPFWPLDEAVKWALGNDVAACAAHLPSPSSKGGEDRRSPPIAPEGRIHVAIDEKSQTAEPGMLYSTPGLRFGDGFGIAVEVEAPKDFDWPESEGAVQLGGEGRPSYRSNQYNVAFPKFEAFEKWYREAASKQSVPGGLRLELLTPAWLHDGTPTGAPAWLPSWLRKSARTRDPTLTSTAAANGCHPMLPVGVRLELVAVSLPGYAPISGWNMQGGRHGHGAPRAVRRLTPAGTVFYFRLQLNGGSPGVDELVEAARALWAVPLEPEPAYDGSNELGPYPTHETVNLNRDSFLAPAARDGFGLVLPGFWWEGLRGPAGPRGTR